MGPLFLDMMGQSRYLLPKVTMNIRLTRKSDQFALMFFKAANQGDVSIKIHEATLYVRHVQVNPAVQIGHEIGLKTQNAHYPLQKTVMRHHNIPAGSSSISLENLFQGKIPKFLTFGLVDGKAFAGDYTKNPFNFQHFNVNRLALYANGVALPYKEFHPDFENGNCVREFLALYQSMEMFGKNQSFEITYEEFQKGGYNLFCFNLTPDLSMNSGQQQKIGNLRLEMGFAKPLVDAINIVIYAIFDSEIQITKAGEVLKT
jgi:hypothetical protein